MPLVNKNGKRLTQADLDALYDMLSGSLQNHIKRINNTNYTQYITHQEVIKPVNDLYQNGLNNLRDTINNANNRFRNMTIDQFTKKVFDDISRGIPGTIPKDDPDRQEKLDDINNFIVNVFGNDQIAKDFYQGSNYDWNTTEGYNKSSQGFKLADVPMQDVDLIAPFDPDTSDVTPLMEKRHGNSETLSGNNNLSQKQQDALHVNDFAMVESRAQACNLKEKSEDYTFSDLWNAFSSINKIVNDKPDNDINEFGKLRGEAVVAGKIKGPGISTIPNMLTKTFDTIADYMNQIKNTPDENLRKTRAIQLAAYAYQMTLSEHVFADGNGRTCRLFADTILQTFGLPPHIPSKAETEIVESIGTPFDFEAGAQVFFDNVMDSNLVLISQDPEKVQHYDFEMKKRNAVRNADEIKIDLDDDFSRRSSISNRDSVRSEDGIRLDDDLNQSMNQSIDQSLDQSIDQSIDRGRDDSIFLNRNDDAEPKKTVEITSDTLKYLENLEELALQARGLKDSQQYTDLLNSITSLKNCTKKILDNKKKGIIDDNAENYDDFEFYTNKMKDNARKYENYKLGQKSEHKNDPSGKKCVNSDDRAKLKLIRNSLKAKCLDVQKPKMLNSEFLKETENAIVRLQNKKYTNMNDYIEDTAYAMIGKMYAVNGGNLPTNKRTGERMKLQEFKDMKIESGEFQDALKVSKDPIKFPNAKSVAKFVQDDKKMLQMVEKMNLNKAVNPKKVVKNAKKNKTVKENENNMNRNVLGSL